MGVPAATVLSGLFDFLGMCVWPILLGVLIYWPPKSLSATVKEFFLSDTWKEIIKRTKRVRTKAFELELADTNDVRPKISETELDKTKAELWNPGNYDRMELFKSIIAAAYHSIRDDELRFLGAIIDESSNKRPKVGDPAFSPMIRLMVFGCIAFKKEDDGCVEMTPTGKFLWDVLRMNGRLKFLGIEPKDQK